MQNNLRILNKICIFVPEMLEDYIINEQIRYENHYLKVAQTDIEIGGVAGAALLSALIVDTEEGARRSIAATRSGWLGSRSTNAK